MKKNTTIITLILYSAVCFTLYIIPFHVPNGIDKLLHILGFALLTILAIASFITTKGDKSLNFFLFILLITGGLLAGVAEYIQGFIPARSCSVEDWVANIFGISLVSASTFVFNIKKQKASNLIKFD